MRLLAARGYHAQTTHRRGEGHVQLLDPDHQGIMAGERLNACGAEAGLPHPGRTLGAAKIKPAMGINEHGEAHEQAIGMLAPVVVIWGLLGLGAASTFPWLQDADHPAMMVGMLAAMLLRRQHYTGAHAPAVSSARRMVPSAT